jgi:DnaJ-class molecular chaperone
MRNNGLKQAIEDARCTLEEVQESGDLEEQIEASQNVAALEKLLFEKEALGVEAKWLECGLCHGSGWHKECEEEWECGLCRGNGGSWI